MPGPVIQTPELPWWLDPKGASVTDSPVVSGLRKAAGWLGLDDPAGSVMGAASPAAPLVSIYPNAAARQVGTRAFIDSAKSMGSGVADAAETFAMKWPRVAAHMNIMPEPAATSDWLAVAHVPGSRVTEPVPIEFSKIGRAISNNMPGKAIDTIAHEGTHVAQALGNSDARNLYEAANQMVGYENNPLEQTARRRAAAEQAGISLNAGQTGGSAKNLFRSISAQAPAEWEGQPALEALRGIVQKRGW